MQIVVIIDASNKFYDLKKDLFEDYRGLKWIIGVAVSLAAGANIGIELGGAALAIFDP